MLSEDYYTQAVATGRLRVEGKVPGGGRGSGGGGGGGGWAASKPLRAGMCIRHFIHRHEPPVLQGDVEVRGGRTRGVRARGGRRWDGR